MASSRRSASKLADLPGDVGRALDALPGLAPDHRIAVAFSGGLDSTALLHAAVRALGAGRVLAVHVDHGLQAVSGEWAERCRRMAVSLGVPVTVVRLDDAPARGDSVEAWARDARYAALAHACADAGITHLLTAHHADDQAETLLLRLARGTGPDGLTGIAPSRREGALWLHRPLLARSRAELAAWAEAAGLAWLEDPSNTDLRFRRNAMRAEVLPALERAVPGAARALGRAADLAREARAVLAEVAATDLAAVRRTDGAAADAIELDRTRLLALPPARRAWVLRHWLSADGARPPSAARLDELARQLLAADAPSGVLDLDDRLVLRHRDRLLLVDGAAALRTWLGRLVAATGAVGGPMDRPGRYPLPGGVGAWVVTEADDAGTPSDGSMPIEDGAWAAGTGRAVDAGVPHGGSRTVAWTLLASVLRSPGLRFETGRRTGLRMRVAAGGPSRTLKNLGQEQGIPGWLRPLFPVLADGDRALCSAAFGADRRTDAGPGRVLRWCPAGEPAAASRLVALFSARRPV